MACSREQCDGMLNDPFEHLQELCAHRAIDGAMIESRVHESMVATSMSADTSIGRLSQQPSCVFSKSEPS